MSHLDRWCLNRSLRAELPQVAVIAGEELVGTPRRVLAFAVHPYDLALFAGGALRRMALTGSEIHAWILTDRDTHDDLGAAFGQAVRRWALDQQGFASVHVCGLDDERLALDGRDEAFVTRSWHEIGPEVVMALSPGRRIVRTTDRRCTALGRTVMNAARDRARSGVRVYLYGTRHANVLVDIDSAFDDKWRGVGPHAELNQPWRAGSRKVRCCVAEAYAAGAGCRLAEGYYRLI